MTRTTVLVHRQSDEEHGQPIIWAQRAPVMWQPNSRILRGTDRVFGYKRLMSTIASELTETLSSVESIKGYLAGLVGAASDNRDGAPVRLTYVGGEFAKNVGIPFEKHVTALAEQGQIAVPKAHRKLAPFAQALCKDIFTLTKEPAGVYFVSMLGAMQDGAERPTVARAPSTLRFHRAIWAAFIRPLEGKRRFLNLDKIGFTNAAEMPSEGNWREIEERFVLGVDAEAPVDGALLQAQIEEWSRHAQVPMSRLVVGAKPIRETSRHFELLFEIIDALPAPLATVWTIPAAVLKHLRDTR